MLHICSCAFFITQEYIMLKSIILIICLIVIICSNLFANESESKPVSFNLGFQAAFGIPEDNYLKWGLGNNYEEHKNTAWLNFIRAGIYTDLLFNFNKHYSLGPEVGIYLFAIDTCSEFRLFFDIPINIIFRISYKRFFLAPYGGLYLMNWDFKEWIQLYDAGGKIGFYIPKRYLRLYADAAYVFGEYNMLRIALGFNVQLY